MLRCPFAFILVVLAQASFDQPRSPFEQIVEKYATMETEVLEGLYDQDPKPELERFFGVEPGTNLFPQIAAFVPFDADKVADAGGVDAHTYSVHEREDFQRLFASAELDAELDARHLNVHVLPQQKDKRRQRYMGTLVPMRRPSGEPSVRIEAVLGRVKVLFYQEDAGVDIANLTVASCEQAGETPTFFRKKPVERVLRQGENLVLTGRFVYEIQNTDTGSTAVVLEFLSNFADLGELSAPDLNWVNDAFVNPPAQNVLEGVPDQVEAPRRVVAAQAANAPGVQYDPSLGTSEDGSLIPALPEGTHSHSDVFQVTGDIGATIRRMQANGESGKIALRNCSTGQFDSGAYIMDDIFKFLQVGGDGGPGDLAKLPQVSPIKNPSSGSSAFMQRGANRIQMAPSAPQFVGSSGQCGSVSSFYRSVPSAQRRRYYVFPQPLPRAWL